jgi:hypothetical protein
MSEQGLTPRQWAVPMATAGTTPGSPGGVVAELHRSVTPVQRIVPVQDGLLVQAWLAMGADGILGIVTTPEEATHMLVMGADGIAGVIEYVPGESLIVMTEQGEMVVPIRAAEAA